MKTKRPSTHHPGTSSDDDANARSSKTNVKAPRPELTLEEWQAALQNTFGSLAHDPDFAAPPRYPS